MEKSKWVFKFVANYPFRGPQLPTALLQSAIRNPKLKHQA
jgi:hypothetical protein